MEITAKLSSDEESHNGEVETTAKFNIPILKFVFITLIPGILVVTSTAVALYYGLKAEDSAQKAEIAKLAEVSTTRMEQLEERQAVHLEAQQEIVKNLKELNNTTTRIDTTLKTVSPSTMKDTLTSVSKRLLIVETKLDSVLDFRAKWVHWVERLQAEFEKRGIEFKVPSL